MGFRLGLLLSLTLIAACSSSSVSIFQKPETAVVVTQWVVVNRGLPVLAAFHNEDDEWMFFADVNPTVDVQVSVTLDELIKLDESLKGLADLPAGWKATRTEKGAPWVRTKIPIYK